MQATLVGLGDISSWPVLLAGLGFAIMAIADKRGIPGAIIKTEMKSNKYYCLDFWSS